MYSISTLLSTLRSGQFWYIFPHLYYKWRRRKDVEETRPVSTVPSGDSKDVPELHLLTGKKHVGDLIYAAKSFIREYESPISLVIHGDGTLQTVDMQSIRAHFPYGQIYTKKARDKAVIPFLEHEDLGSCVKFREANVFGERLVDTAVLAQSTMVINLDTDCLSFAPLDELRSHIENCNVTYIKDPQEHPYSISKQDAQDRFGTIPVPYFNAGLCAFPKEQLNLDRVEQWLRPPGYPASTHYAEQTILAALAALGPAQPLSTENYTFDWQDKKAAFIHYAGHYLSKTRVVMRQYGQKHILEK